MIKGYTYKPVRFFVITFAVTWISWFLSAFFSYREDGQSLYILFMLPGLVAPFGAALWMILTSGNKELKKDFVRKLIDLRLIKLSTLPSIILIMPAAVAVSIPISTLFGQSLGQFQLAEGFSFSVGAVPVLLVLVLAASFEELGWRSYAMDSLRVKLNYFQATMIFAVLWALWHLPLFFINNYYQNEIVRMNVLYGLNFMVAVIPMAFIISWLWEKNNGSIPVAILFHFFINMAQEALRIEQATKCIETVVLIAIAAVVVLTNKEMFFDKKEG